MASVECEWPDGCKNIATKAWPPGEPCPHVMICKSHDNVEIGHPSAGALFSLWVERQAIAKEEREK